MPGEEKLRDEIMALHAAHRDLARWKLIAVGAIGALGLGISAPTGSGFNLAVLSLAPLLAVYCDLLLREYDLRVAIIAAFLRKEGGAFAKYEAFIIAARLTHPRPSWSNMHPTSTRGACIPAVVWQDKDTKDASAMCLLRVGRGEII